MTKLNVKIQVWKPILNGGWCMDVCVNGRMIVPPPIIQFATRREATLWAKNWCFVVGTALLEKAK